MDICGAGAADGQAHSERTACPFPGRHRVHTYDDQDGGGFACPIYFRSGCDASSAMDVVNSCTLRPGKLRRSPLHSPHNSKATFLLGLSCLAQLAE